MATIPLFPLSNALFPAGVLHLRIFEVRYLDMIRRCIEMCIRDRVKRERMNLYYDEGKTLV